MCLREIKAWSSNGEAEIAKLVNGRGCVSKSTEKNPEEPAVRSIKFHIEFLRSEIKRVKSEVREIAEIKAE